MGGREEGGWEEGREGGGRKGGGGGRREEEGGGRLREGGRERGEMEGEGKHLHILCTPQLTALVTSFYLSLSQNYVDAMFLRQIREIGFLAHFESLLSSMGKGVLFPRLSTT